MSIDRAGATSADQIPDTGDLMFWDVDDELTEVHEHGAGAGPESVKPTLVGLCADPASSPEDWESDFDFDAPAGESSNPLSLTMYPTSTKRSNSAHDAAPPKRPTLTISAAERRELEELHNTLPVLPFDSDSIECDTPRAHKLIVKDLLRDIQAASGEMRSKANESDSSESPRRSVEVLEQELAAAVAGKSLQSRVAAYMELARAYRSSGQTGAAMVQLQHAQRELQERATKPEDASGSGQPNEVFTEAHVLHEMAITARKIQDLNSAKGYLQRAIWAITSATSLSPLWSPLWLRLHVDAGGVMLALGELKTALWHLSQHVAGLAARSAPTKSDSQPTAAWHKFHRDLCAGCLYLGGTLHCAGVYDLARSFLQTSAGACEVLDENKEKEWLRSLVHPWLLCAIAETTVSETASLDEFPNAENASDGPTPKGSVQEESLDAGEESDEEEEDWDKELEIEEQERGNFLRTSLSNMFSASRAINLHGAPVEQGALPERWLLTKSLAEKTSKPVIVMYPKSSTMYSLRSKRIMTEASAQTWLESLISSHRESYLEGRKFAEEEGTELGQELCSVLAGTGEWAALHVQHIFKLYKEKQNPAACWQRIQDFFVGLRACCMPGEEAEVHGWADMDEAERVERILLVRACQTLLSIATRLWKPDYQSQFQQFLFVARSAGLGRSESMVELIELEGMGHHSSDTKAIVLPALCRLYETATARDKGGDEDIPVTVAEPQPQAESESENKKRKMDQWGRWGRGDAALDELGLSDAETRAAVLVDIQLCTEGLSPLTCGKPVAKWDSGKDAATGGEKSESPRILTDEEYRLATILKLYQRIRPNLALRAKVAFVLGSYELRRKEGAGRAIAEQLLLEAVFVLDTCCPSVPGISALVSELGERCLIRYGEALLENTKYRYAVLSLEAAADCNLLRTRVQPHLLYRRLAVICADNGDYERSFRYYGIVLTKAKQEQKVDEYVFASERVADILLEHGDFQQAEQLLGSAGLLLEAEQGIASDGSGTPTEGSKGGARLDSRYVRLQLRVAKMLLDGYDTWRGVQLLKTLAAKNLPHAKKGAVQALLASGYYKVWQTAECDSCLASAGASMDGLRAQMGSDAIGLIRTGVKNLLREGRPGEALRKLDAAIVGEQRLSGLGQLYMLRGKVLQALAARAAGDPSAIPPGFSNAVDVARAGAEALQMSWDAFSRLGDSMLQAKAASRYAQARLDAVWCSHVLLNRPWEVNLAETAPKTLPKPSPTTSPVLKRPDRPFHTRSSGRSSSLVGIPERSGSGILASSNRRETSDADALWSIERAAVLALDEAMATLSDLRLLLRSHLNMAEVRWLQGHKSLALAHFCECRDLFFGLLTYPDGRFALSDGPISFARSALATLNRMTRFVLALDTATITHNLAIFDAVLHLEADINSLLQTGPAPGSGAEGGRRIWSLLHCMRSMGRQAQARRITREEAARRNHGALRKIWRIRATTQLYPHPAGATIHRPAHEAGGGGGPGTGSATSVVPVLGFGGAAPGDASPKSGAVAAGPPEEMGPEGGALAPLVMSSRSGALLTKSNSFGQSGSGSTMQRPGTVPKESPRDCAEAGTSTESLAGRHVYMLCLMEQFVAVFCPGTGLLELHLLGGGMGGGLLEDEAVGYVEGALKGSLTAQKEPEPKRKVARTTLGRYRSSSKSAPSTEPDPSSSGMGSVAASTLAQMLVKVLRPLLEDPAEEVEGKVPCKAPPPEKKRKPGRILKWLGCFAKTSKPDKAVIGKKDSLPDVGEKLSLPVFLACSAVLRAVPWEAVKLGLPMVRSLGIRPYKPPIPVDPTHGGDSGTGFGVVLLHSNKWQKKDEASFNGKRGALARNWLTAIQQRRWALPWRSGGPGDEGSASVWRWPLHAPLVRPNRGIGHLRRKYSHVTFLESDSLLEGPQGLPRMLEAQTPSGSGSRGRINPLGREEQELLIVVPFCELLRIPAALSLALASRPACTIAFCPDSAMKPLVKALKGPGAPETPARGGPAAGLLRGEAFLKLVRIVHAVMLDTGVPIALLTSSKMVPAPSTSGNASPHQGPGQSPPLIRSSSLPTASAGFKLEDRGDLPTILEPAAFAARRDYTAFGWPGGGASEESSTNPRKRGGSAEEAPKEEAAKRAEKSEEKESGVKTEGMLTGRGKEAEDDDDEWEDETGWTEELDSGKKRKLARAASAVSKAAEGHKGGKAESGNLEAETVVEEKASDHEQGVSGEDKTEDVNTKADDATPGEEEVVAPEDVAAVVEGGEVDGGEPHAEPEEEEVAEEAAEEEVAAAEEEAAAGEEEEAKPKPGVEHPEQAEEEEETKEEEEEEEEKNAEENKAEEEEEAEAEAEAEAGGRRSTEEASDGLVHQPLEVESRSGPRGNKGVGVRSTLKLAVAGDPRLGGASHGPLSRPGVVRIEFQGREPSLSPPGSTAGTESLLSPASVGSHRTSVMSQMGTWTREALLVSGDAKDSPDAQGAGAALSPRPDSEADSVRADGNPRESTAAARESGVHDVEGHELQWDEVPEVASDSHPPSLATPSPAGDASRTVPDSAESNDSWLLGGVLFSGRAAGTRSSSFTSNSDKLPALMPGALVSVGGISGRGQGSVRSRRPASDGELTPGSDAMEDSENWTPVTVPNGSMVGEIDGDDDDDQSCEIPVEVLTPTVLHMADQPPSTLELEQDAVNVSCGFRSLSQMLPDAGSGVDSDSSGWLASDEARSPAGDSFLVQSVIHEEPEHSDDLNTPQETPRSEIDAPERASSAE